LLGIILTGGEGPSAQVIKQLIETKTKDGILLAAADSGLEKAENAGLTPDWIIGDFDSLDDSSRLDSYPPERVIRLQCDKDYTDTELAVMHTFKQGCNDVWIIGGGGGRIDHLFAIRSLLERKQFPCRWITDTADIHCIEADNEICFDRNKETTVSVFPLGTGPWEAGSSGLKWTLDGLPWDCGFFGLSNRAPDGKFSVKIEKGRFMVILPGLEEACQQL